MHGEMRGWHTPIYEITPLPPYFSFLALARESIISPYYVNNIIKINNTNKNLLWL